jgi:hypothetical protein
MRDLAPGPFVIRAGLGPEQRENQGCRMVHGASGRSMAHVIWWISREAELVWAAGLFRAPSNRDRSMCALTASPLYPGGQRHQAAV